MDGIMHNRRDGGWETQDGRRRNGELSEAGGQEESERKHTHTQAEWHALSIIS